MIIDRIKISKEIRVGMLGMWVGMEGTTSPEEDTIRALTELERKINRYVVEQHGISNTITEPLYSPNSHITTKDMEQKLILMAELEAAKTTKEVTTIFNEAPQSIKADQEFFDAILKAKERVGS